MLTARFIGLNCNCYEAALRQNPVSRFFKEIRTLCQGFDQCTPQTRNSAVSKGQNSSATANIVYTFRCEAIHFLLSYSGALHLRGIQSAKERKFVAKPMHKASYIIHSPGETYDWRDVEQAAAMLAAFLKQ